MSPELFSLQGKVVLLTGGYGYLGQSIASGLAEFGAHVFVLGKSEEKFQQIFSGSKSISFETCDVGQTASVEAAFSSVAKNAGKIDVLINNAFFCRGNDVEKMSDDDWEFSIEGTLNSVHRCVRAVLPYLKRRSRGKIINVSSIYGMVAPHFSIYEDFPQQLNPSHYGAAKAGVIQLTRYFAVFLGPHNINVNCVTPGTFPSAKTQENNAFIAELTELSPLKRIGHPDDLKGAFIFLSSGASDYVTGHNLVVDGGWTAW
ncbi:MAG: SDR family oxidoreductase [Proteobacteria bacterium]|nr:SDR family oxidoreductase [Pseudomonadota bacterium]